jgi:hypothetical protein
VRKQHWQKRQNFIEIRLIDVKNKQLKKSRSSEKYIALSYVWGDVRGFHANTSNIELLEQKKGLCMYWSKIPLTIRHAIKFSSTLGVRYLWVDALCILQDHADEKHSQIRNMHMVYSHAFLTLIAFSSTSAEAGLLGIGQDTQVIPKFMECINGQTFAAARVLDFNKPEHCVYESRGWTFQERVLSKRCLYLMENNIFFQCFTLSKSAFGTIELETYSPREINPMALALASSPGADPESEVILFFLFIACVQLYSQRELSHPTDILYAFAGIIGKLQELVTSPFPFFFGLPERFLDLALLWRAFDWGSYSTNRKYTRRLCLMEKSNSLFPSWSWAGWEGRLEYQYLLLHAQHDGSLLGMMSQFKNMIHKLGFASHIQTFVVHQGPHLRALSRSEVLFMASPPNELVPAIPCELSCPPGTLHFTADLLSPYSFETGEDGIVLLDKFHRVCGSILGRSPFSSHDRSSNPSRNWLKLSQTKNPLFCEPTECISKLILKTGEIPFFYLMLVQWSGYYAERLAVALVASTAWESAIQCGSFHAKDTLIRLV